mmetsp:Transcript_7998/g.49408  ORF Transcript_7998/g.49408 Transcript_7998/m.49408 type:complete len:560 (-) Transcript_7998:194-1873(-)
MDKMVAAGPLFCDITWGAGGSTADLTLDITKQMQNMICVETMMHLTCTNMPKEKLEHALQALQECGVQNILALRGDPPKGQETFVAAEGGFSCALDLIKFIRDKCGDVFGIGCAGYPEAHPDVICEDPEQMAKNYHSDLMYLKEKIDAGADFIVTQLFYEVELFLKFVKDCREIGINCPILPGIMPIQSYGGFQRMTGFCKTKVPQFIKDALEPIKDNDEAVKAYGIQLAVDMCRRILDSGASPGVHLYSLNMDRSVMAIVEQLHLTGESKIQRPLPWRPPTSTKRNGEMVRPIFWANRPKSYLQRTENWDSYPNGRWKESSNAAFGTLSESKLIRPKALRVKESKMQQWGEELSSIDDVQAVFSKFCKGEISYLPWVESEGGLQSESKILIDQLVTLNTSGFLTINSQPRVNGAPSSDPKFGWGQPNGYVYQKQYVEFFCTKEKLLTLKKKMANLPNLSYQAVNAKGEVLSNISEADVNAVTWGVFPASEIIQPTVVDPKSFLVWKDEAFSIWLSVWASAYEEGSRSRQLLQEIHDTYYLVNIVDNDFVQGDLFSLFA